MRVERPKCTPCVAVISDLWSDSGDSFCPGKITFCSALHFSASFYNLTEIPLKEWIRLRLLSSYMKQQRVPRWIKDHEDATDYADYFISLLSKDHMHYPHFKAWLSIVLCRRLPLTFTAMKLFHCLRPLRAPPSHLPLPSSSSLSFSLFFFLQSAVITERTSDNICTILTPVAQHLLQLTVVAN